MRIAVVTTSYPESDDDPSGHFVRADVNELTQQGHHVTVICPGAKADSTCGGNPTLVRLGATTLFGWPGALAKLRAKPWAIVALVPFIVRARAALRDGRFDHVTAHWLVPCGWPIANGSQGTTEIVVHGSDARLVARLPVWLRQRLLLSLHARDVRLRFVAPHLRALLRTPRTEAWIMSSTVLASALCLPALPNRSETRRQLGLKQAAFVVTIIGRLVTSKRVEVALARAQLPPNAQIYVIGSGPCLGDLRQRFPHVVFLEQLPRTQTLMWLNASDLLLNASLLEGAPSVVREARALGVDVWTAPCEAASNWATHDPGISVRPELA